MPTVQRRREIARKNLEYAELFTQELLHDKSFSRCVPKGASVYFIPDSDPELAAFNRKLAQRARKQEKKVVFVLIELVPRTTFVPRLTVQKATVA